MEFTVLDTDRGAALTGTPWQEYPRPSLRRDSFVNLNGEWDFAVGDPAQLPEHFDRTIRVPFPPESKLSGIGQVFPEEQALYYRKNFTLPEEFVGRGPGGCRIPERKRIGDSYWRLSGLFL